jgi:hypothetical protein
MATRLDKRSTEANDAQADPAKNSINLNRWLARAVAVLVAAVIALVILLITDGDNGNSSITVTGPDTVSAVFPTGTYEATNGYSGVEFSEDGTCRHFALPSGWEVPCTYAVNDDLFTETTFEYQGGVQAPVTYFWAFDGVNLTFELWGEDVRSHRQQVYAQVFTKVE